jgi:hypothetical protein
LKDDFQDMVRNASGVGLDVGFRGVKGVAAGSEFIVLGLETDLVCRKDDI